MVRAVLLTRLGGHGSAESGDENQHDALITCTFRKQRTIFRTLCFEKKNLEGLKHDVTYKSTHHSW